MALTNSQYDEIQRQYDAKQIHNRHVVEQRKKKLYEAYPRLKELDGLIASSSTRRARQLLEGNTDAPRLLKQDIGRYRAEWESILAKAGFTKDDLEPTYTCPDCRDTGYIGSKRCHCFKQAAIDLIYTQSNIKNILADENFASFSYQFYSDNGKDPKTGLSPRENARKAVKEVLAFLANFDKKFQNLLLYGETGTGKTFLSNCIAKELLDTGHSVIYFSAFQLFEILEKQKFQKDQKAGASMQNIFDCDLLIIDDLGTEFPNNFTVSQLFVCLNERLLQRKSTVISTNLDFDKLSAIYTERVFSRLVSSYKIIKLFGSDIRLQKMKAHPTTKIL